MLLLIWYLHEHQIIFYLKLLNVWIFQTSLGVRGQLEHPPLSYKRSYTGYWWQPKTKEGEYIQ